jgi:hypothetical protein
MILEEKAKRGREKKTKAQPYSKILESDEKECL